MYSRVKSDNPGEQCTHISNCTEDYREKVYKTQKPANSSATISMDRNFSFSSESEADASSVESFDKAYDRMLKEMKNQQEEVSEHQANIMNHTVLKQVEIDQIKTGPVVNISEKILEKEGMSQNIFNYNLRFDISPTTTSKMIIAGLCLVGCVIAPILLHTLDNQPNPTIVPCTGKCSV